MVTALVMGFLGIGLAFFVGGHYLGIALLDIAQTVLAANIAGFTSLIVILNAQQVKFIKKYLLPTISMTWVFFVGIFLGMTYLFSPPSIGGKELALLIFPLIFSTGFCILVFGPIQDRIISWKQRTGRM